VASHDSSTNGLINTYKEMKQRHRDRAKVKTFLLYALCTKPDLHLLRGNLTLKRRS